MSFTFEVFFIGMCNKKGNPSDMGVSENNGTSKSCIFNKVFHSKPSILGYPYLWKHPYVDFSAHLRQGIESGRSHPDEVFQVTQGVNERTGIDRSVRGPLVSTGQG